MSAASHVNKSNVLTWPKDVRQAVDAIAIVFMQAYMLVRSRASQNPSPTVRILAQRDTDAYKLSLKDRELAIFQRCLGAMPPLTRPHFLPEDRFEILQLMRLQNLSVDAAAKRYVVHPNTLRDWRRKFGNSLVEPHHILRPNEINRTWHLDMTTLEFFWIRFYVAVVVDGFSRKLLTLKVYTDAPTSAQMLNLVRQTFKSHGKPRFLVTDHGYQFRTWFKVAMRVLEISVGKWKGRKVYENIQDLAARHTLRLKIGLDSATP